MSEDGVPNYDWAKEIAESTTDTIDRHLPPTLHHEMHPVDFHNLHVGIRRAIAAELLKLEHRYKARIVAMQPANIAYQLKSRADEIGGWEAAWEVTVHYAEGPPDVYPVDSYEKAADEIDVLSSRQDVVSVYWRMK